MPTGSLPSEGKKIWERVHGEAKKGSCKSSDDVEACSAKVAWKAVKNAGYFQDKDGNWHKRSVVEEFSLRIERASFDKATGEKRWRAVASDTEADTYNDSMTLELYGDFINRIDSKEPVPEQFRSNFWNGGMPYVSVSHYPDLEGKAVPGMADAVYIDGKYFKSKGKFDDTPLGDACFRAICEDLYSEKRNEIENKVRVSIAFLDYMHKHKSNGYIFERNSLEDWCPECFKEMVEGNFAGKEFLKGHLIHLALTRVPVNKRTIMEVDKSMTTTRKEDAASIIGEELAETIEEEAKLVGKSEALVIKAEDEVEEVQPDEIPVVEEEKAKSKKEDKPAEDEEETEDDEKEMKKKKSEISELRSMVENLTVLMQPKEEVVEPHPLDTVLSKMKSDFDEIVKSDLSVDEKLRTLQGSYEEVGNVLKSLVVNEPIQENKEQDVVKAFSEAIERAMTPIAQKLELVAAQLSGYNPAIQQPVTNVPARRSLQLPQKTDEYVNQYLRSKSETPHLRAIIEQTV